MQYAFSWTTFPTACVLALALSLPGQAQSANNEERPIRALIQDFADARNSHDGITVASFYSDDGEWIAARGVRTVRGRAALVELWTGLSGQVRRTVRSVDLVSDSIAFVRVTAQYEEPIGRHNEVFVLVKDLGKWRIRVHQTD
jgi:uncharacterized protein (TIGR02246 family)